ncbi:MAG TPA: L,D-transpeptidase family protein, partial [Bauldia sp.]|nr:L,D-transpeptidase family protein [Bauldia sp.]
SSEFEVWKQTRSGDYALLKTYQICKWSGALGPKKVEGDRQAPEGIYTVTPAQMNPASHYYLSFNIGYPNSYDRSLGRTGSNLMVHGACSSAGCYSMTDPDAGELFALARDAFRGGQTAFQIQAFPFRMTPENLAKHHDDPNMPFWQMLKVASDTFDLTHRPPKTDVCDRHYVFNADSGPVFDPDQPCPQYTVPDALAQALAQKKATDDAAYAADVAALQAEQQAATAKAAAAAEQAVKDQEAAATRAAQPSLFSRMFGGASARAQASTSVAATKAVVTAGSTATTPPTAASAAVPTPRLRPGVTTVSAPAGATIKPDMTPASPPVGTFVKKDFCWPGDTSPECAAPNKSG